MTIASDILSTAIITGPTTLLSGFSALQSTKVRRKQLSYQAQTDKRKVDAEAYDRAKGIYESLITELEDQLTRMRDQTRETRTSYDELQRELWQEQRNTSARNKQVAALQDKLRELQYQIEDMERTIADMRRQLISAGLDISS